MNDLTIGKERNVILKFAAPMLVGNLFQQTYTIFDSIIVGKLIGDEALAAVGASFPIIFALISFVIGISSAGTIIISQYYGAKHYDNVRKAIDTIFIFVFLASIAITANVSSPILAMISDLRNVSLRLLAAWLNSLLPVS